MQHMFETNRAYPELSISRFSQYMVMYKHTIYKYIPVHFIALIAN